jgi:hypothetical protein
MEFGIQRELFFRERRSRLRLSSQLMDSVQRIFVKNVWHPLLVPE